MIGITSGVVFLTATHIQKLKRIYFTLRGNMLISHEDKITPLKILKDLLHRYSKTNFNILIPFS